MSCWLDDREAKIAGDGARGTVGDTDWVTNGGKKSTPGFQIVPLDRSVE